MKCDKVSGSMCERSPPCGDIGALAQREPTLRFLRRYRRSHSSACVREDPFHAARQALSLSVNEPLDSRSVCEREDPFLATVQALSLSVNQLLDSPSACVIEHPFRAAVQSKTTRCTQCPGHAQASLRYSCVTC